MKVVKDGAEISAVLQNCAVIALFFSSNIVATPLTFKLERDVIRLLNFIDSFFERFLNFKFECQFNNAKVVLSTQTRPYTPARIVLHIVFYTEIFSFN